MSLGNNQFPADEMFPDEFDKLYGSVWLLENIARECGLMVDLYEAFDESFLFLDDVLTLAIYLYLGKGSLDRVARWQDIYRTPTSSVMDMPYICRMMRRIRNDTRLKLIRYRMQWLSESDDVDGETEAGTGLGKCLLNIHWCESEQSDEEMDITEMTGYSEKTHEPFYYRAFERPRLCYVNLREAIDELNDLGVKDVLAVTGRGRPPCDPVPIFVGADIPFIIRTDVSRDPVSEVLLNRIKYNAIGLPVNLQYDQSRKMYCGQFDVSGCELQLTDGETVKIDSLKVNVFLDVQGRLPALQKLSERIRKEADEIERVLQKGVLPENIDRVNFLYTYHKLVYDRKEKTIHVVQAEEKIARAESQCGYTASLMYKTDLDAKEAFELAKARDGWEMYQFDEPDWDEREEYPDVSSRRFIEFCGAVLYSRIREVWRNTMLNVGYGSPIEALDEMTSIKYISRLKRMTMFTGDQVRICQYLEIEPPEDCVPDSMRKSMKVYRDKLNQS